MKEKKFLIGDDGVVFLVFQSIFYKRIYFISKRKFINRLNQTFYHNSTCSYETNTSVMVFVFEAVSGKNRSSYWLAMDSNVRL